MDCIHYKIRKDGRIFSRATYIVLAITLDGYKYILGITVLVVVPFGNVERNQLLVEVINYGKSK